MSVSVIVATYKRCDALRRAVESLRCQTSPPEEIIVVAWSGDAASVRVAEELAGEPGRASGSAAVRPLFVHENTVAAKENAGMRAAGGDIVCFMDDDAVAHPDWLERLKRQYADPDVGAVGGRDIVWKDGALQPSREVRRVGSVYWFGRLVANHHERSTGVREVDFLKGCNMSFRRDALSLVDPRLVGVIPYGFEIDLSLVARGRGRRVIYDPDTTVDHHSASDMSPHLVSLAYVTNHNQTYVLLKHLSWPRKIAFLIYTFSVGDKSTIGLLRIPWLVFGGGWSLEAVRAHFAGKLRGLQTYLAHRGERPGRHAVASGGVG